MAILGERIANLRLAKKDGRGKSMTRAALARKVGVTRSAVSQWESGDTNGLKPENLVKCADALGVTVRALVFGVDRSSEGVSLAERLTALPLALREYLLQMVVSLEDVAHEIPFAFRQPLDPESYASFHRYLEKITSERIAADDQNEEKK